MPRPGQRPYECVRRAWHSDSHQPKRASIVQQILRLVYESHSSVTKKNTEWQEKLPVVVFKAEEIMYSKAESEAEYMDPETLWDRVNDAINVIIRRDETMETDKLLPPCVEAALNLGCIPIRATRSQRQTNARSYLCPRSQELVQSHVRTSDNDKNEWNPNSLPVHSGNQRTFARPIIVNSTHLISKSNRNAIQKSYPYNNNQMSAVEDNMSLNLGSVYPLYYGTHSQPKVSFRDFQNPPENSPTVVGTPVFSLAPEPVPMGCLQNLLSCDGHGNALNRVIELGLTDDLEKDPQMRCDLSLRLGLSIDSCMSRGKVSAHDIGNVGPSNSEGSKFGIPENKEFSFFPVESANEPVEFHKSNWNTKGEDQILDSANKKKRKALFSNNMEDWQFFGQPEQTSNMLNG